MTDRKGISRHAESAFDESRAVRILSEKLEEGRRIRTFFRENDRTPNHDGFFELVTEDGVPRKQFIVQIKKTGRMTPEKKGKNKGKYVYRLETAFLSYVKNRVTDAPAVYFTVDIDTGNIFWVYLSEAFLDSVDFEGKRSVVYAFSEQEILRDTEEFCRALEKILSERGKNTVWVPDGTVSEEDAAERNRRLRRVREVPGYAGNEIDREIVPAAADEAGRRITYTELEAYMTSAGIRAVQILGEGGTGKTSYLRCFADELEKSGARVSYIPLGGADGAEPASQTEAVNRAEMTNRTNAMDRLMQLDELMQAQAAAPSGTGVRTGVRWVLLDGFNEIRSDFRMSAARQIGRLLEQENIRIVIALRQKITGTYRLYGIPVLRMQKLSREQTEQYLIRHGSALPESFGELLSVPMMLTVYADTNRELALHRDSLYFRFHERNGKRAYLILDYMESLAAKYFMQGGGEEQRDLALALYTGHFLLPYIAYRMERERCLTVSEDVMYRYVEDFLDLQREERFREEKRGEADSAAARWFARRGIGDISGIEELTFAQAAEYLRSFPDVFSGWGQWAFAHQNYRDTLAASYIVSVCTAACDRSKYLRSHIGSGHGDSDFRGVIPDVLNYVISEETIQFIAELLEGNEEMPDAVLDLLRYRPGDEVRIPLYNVLQIIKYRDQNLAGTNFRGLDLKGQILGPFIDSRGKRTDFTDAVIYPETLLPAGHKSRVSKVCHSPDGKCFATASEDGCVCVWETATCQLLRRLQMSRDDFMTGLLFSPDSAFLAAASFRTVEVWDMEDESVHRIFPCNMGDDLSTADPAERLISFDDTISNICWHPYRRQMIYGRHSGKVNVVDVRNGTLLLSLEQEEEVWDRRRGGRMDVCVYSTDGSRIAAGGSDGYVRIWDSGTGRLLRSFPAHDVPEKYAGMTVRDLRFTPDHKLLSAGEDGTLALWDAGSGEDTGSGDLLKRFEGHRKWIHRISLNEDGALAASASADHTVRIWSLKEGRCVHVLRGHEEIVQWAEFQPGGTLLASADCGGVIGIWDAVSGKNLHMIHAHGDIVGGISFSPDGTRLMAASLDGDVSVWNADTGVRIQTLNRSGRKVRRMRLTADQRLLTADTPEHMDRVWDLRTGKCVWEKRDEIWEDPFSPDGKKALIFTEEKRLELWDIIQNIRLWSKPCDEEISSVTWDGGQRHVTALTDERNVLSVDMMSGEIIPTRSSDTESAGWQTDAEWHAGDLRDIKRLYPDDIILDVSSDRGHTLTAVLLGDGEIILADPENGKERKRLRIGDRCVTGIEFSDDGEILLCCADQIVYGLELKTGRWSILADQRYEERLEGCELVNTVFADGMEEKDIRLLKRYSV